MSNIPAADDYRDAADGGPAFPKVPDDSRNGSAGMSLRDWFAGQALAGMLPQEEHGVCHYASDTAEMAYRYADAMIEARNGTTITDEMRLALAELVAYIEPNLNRELFPEEARKVDAARRILDLAASRS